MARKRKPQADLPARPDTGQRAIARAPASKPPMTSLPPPPMVPVRRASRARRPGR